MWRATRNGKQKRCADGGAEDYAGKKTTVDENEEIDSHDSDHGSDADADTKDDRQEEEFDAEEEEDCEEDDDDLAFPMTQASGGQVERQYKGAHILREVEESGYTPHQKASLKKLVRSMLCSECNDLFLEPITLAGCSHTFCRECLEERDSRTCECPRCGIPSYNEERKPQRDIVDGIEAFYQVIKVLREERKEREKVNPEDQQQQLDNEYILLNEQHQGGGFWGMGTQSSESMYSPSSIRRRSSIESVNSVAAKTPLVGDGAKASPQERSTFSTTDKSTRSDALHDNVVVPETQQDAQEEEPALDCRIRSEKDQQNEQFFESFPESAIVPDTQQPYHEDCFDPGDKRESNSNHACDKDVTSFVADTQDATVVNETQYKNYSDSECESEPDDKGKQEKEEEDEDEDEKETGFIQPSQGTGYNAAIQHLVKVCAKNTDQSHSNFSHNSPREPEQMHVTDYRGEEQTKSKESDNFREDENNFSAHSSKTFDCQRVLRGKVSRRSPSKSKKISIEDIADFEDGYFSMDDSDQLDLNSNDTRFDGVPVPTSQHAACTRVKLPTKCLPEIFVTNQRRSNESVLVHPQKEDSEICFEQRESLAEKKMEIENNAQAEMQMNECQSSYLQNTVDSQASESQSRYNLSQLRTPLTQDMVDGGQQWRRDARLAEPNISGSSNAEPHSAIYRNQNIDDDEIDDDNDSEIVLRSTCKVKLNDSAVEDSATQELTGHHLQLSVSRANHASAENQNKMTEKSGSKNIKGYPHSSIVQGQHEYHGKQPEEERCEPASQLSRRKRQRNRKSDKSFDDIYNDELDEVDESLKRRSGSTDSFRGLSRLSSSSSSRYQGSGLISRSHKRSFSTEDENDYGYLDADKDGDSDNLIEKKIEGLSTSDEEELAPRIIRRCSGSTGVKHSSFSDSRGRYSSDNDVGVSSSSFTSSTDFASKSRKNERSLSLSRRPSLQLKSKSSANTSQSKLKDVDLNTRHSRQIDDVDSPSGKRTQRSVWKRHTFIDASGSSSAGIVSARGSRSSSGKPLSGVNHATDTPKSVILNGGGGGGNWMARSSKSSKAMRKKQQSKLTDSYARNKTSQLGLSKSGLEESDSF